MQLTHINTISASLPRYRRFFFNNHTNDQNVLPNSSTSCIGVEPLSNTIKNIPTASIENPESPNQDYCSIEYSLRTFKVGEDEIKKKDIVTSRLMKSKRRDRKLAVREFICKRIMRNEQRSPTVQDCF